MIQKLDKYGNTSVDNANVVILDKNGKVKNLNYTGGTVTSIITASPITGGPITTTGTIGITQATTSTDGYLSSTDWNTFNSKFNLPTLTSGSVLFSNGTTIAQDNAQFFWDDTNNRLGIGTTTPTQKLDVIGSTKTDVLYLGGTSNYLDIATGMRLRSDANGINFVPNGTQAVKITGAGNVGIGTITPAKLLDVNGDVLINGQTVGRGGGNINSNTTVGSSALTSNTTGTNNVSIGTSTLFLNTTGANNVAIGSSGLGSNISGGSNTAIGQGSLQNSIGSSNTAIGQASLSSITSGGTNIAFGRFAGRYIADKVTLLTSIDNSVLLGYQASPLGQAQTNQIVIGYDATGLGSNTTVLGNSSTTTTAIYGNVGIGTTSPLSKFHVRPKIDQNLRVSLGTTLEVNSINDADSAYTPITFRASSFNFANGNVGIGTTSPSEKLSVAGNINLLLGSGGTKIGFNVGTGFTAYGTSKAHYGLTYSNDTNPVILSGYDGVSLFTRGAERLTVSSTGNVGIGTTSPTSKLQSNNASTYNSTTPSGAIIASNLSNGNAVVDIGVDSALLGYIQSRNITSTTSYNLLLNPIGGNVGIGTTAPTAKLHIAAPGALSTDIALRVRNSADSADLITVNGLGNVGIGITTPAGKLDLYDSTSSSLYVRIGSVGANWITSGTVSQLGTYTNHPLVFKTNDTARMRIVNTTGNVLINTVTDIASSKLTVESTTQGFLPPRMTNAQIIAIATPAVGLCVYCTDAVEGLYINKSTGWTYIG